MSSLKRILGTAIAGALLAATGAVAQSVKLEFKSPAQLTGYRTYSIAKVGATDAPMEPRLAAAIDHELQLKGWHKVSSNPEVLVTAVIADNNDGQRFATFYGSLKGDMPQLQSTIANGESPANMTAGTLAVDMYDKNSGQLIWRSTATDFLGADLDKNLIKVDAAVNRMFATLPWDDTSFGDRKPIEVDN